jgi:hypothetical protein
MLNVIEQFLREKGLRIAEDRRQADSITVYIDARSTFYREWKLVKHYLVCQDCLGMIDLTHRESLESFARVAKHCCGKGRCKDCELYLYEDA